VMENFHGNFFGQSRGAYFFHVYALWRSKWLFYLSFFEKKCKRNAACFIEKGEYLQA
jgi:hypothetical protein